MSGEALFVDVGAAVPVVAEGSRRYSRALAELRGVRVSGVYVLVDGLTGQALYVGESHSGRLFETITRHFRQWQAAGVYANGRRAGGVSYERSRVLVAWRVVEPEYVSALQWAEILRLNPRDNERMDMPSEVRQAVADGGAFDEVPF